MSQELSCCQILYTKLINQTSDGGRKSKVGQEFKQTEKHTALQRIKKSALWNKFKPQPSKL